MKKILAFVFISVFTFSKVRAQTPYKLSIAPDMSFDWGKASFVSGYKSKDYTYLDKLAVGEFVLNLGISLQLELLHKWKINAGIRQHTFSGRAIYSDPLYNATPNLKHISSRQIWYNAAKLYIFSQYNFATTAINKGMFKSLSFKWYAGLGLSYNQVPSYSRVDTFTKNLTLSLSRNLIFDSYRKNLKKGNASIQVGISSEVLYKNKTYCQFSLRYAFSFSPLWEDRFYIYDQYNNVTEETRNYPGMQQVELQLAFPIRIVSNYKRINK